MDVTNPSQVSAIAEPFYLILDVSVEFRVAMTREDLAAPDLEAHG